jgi:hypothetical protein
MSVIDEIAAERRRQIEGEGWTHEHDDEHEDGEMATAAACYVRPDLRLVEISDDGVQLSDPWPWWDEFNEGRLRSREKAWWKPKDRRRDLIRAAALIVAEIERLDRRPHREGLTP